MRYIVAQRQSAASRAGTHDPSPLDNLRAGVWSFALDQRAFGRARLIAADYGIHLVDWIACDDDRLHSNRVPIFSAGAEAAAAGWWDVPAI